MATKPFKLATTEEGVKKQLQEFFERAARARYKFDAYCEKVGMPAKDFWENNLERLYQSADFQNFVNQTRSNFQLLNNAQPRQKAVLDFGGVQLNIPTPKEEKK